MIGVFPFEYASILAAIRGRWTRDPIVLDLRHEILGRLVEMSPTLVPRGAVHAAAELVTAENAHDWGQARSVLWRLRLLTHSRPSVLNEP